MRSKIEICPICHKKCEYTSWSDERGEVEFIFNCKCGGIHWSYGKVFSIKPKWYRMIRRWRYNKYIKKNGLGEE